MHSGVGLRLPIVQQIAVPKGPSPKRKGKGDRHLDRKLARVDLIHSFRNCRGDLILIVTASRSFTIIGAKPKRSLSLTF